MTIEQIKRRLTLSAVLQYYGLKPDKNLRLHCPFHADKTPSLQVYYKTHTCYCFSSGCKTHGKSLDVIDFIMYKENVTKAEAILKAVSLIENGKWNVEALMNTVEITNNRENKVEKEKVKPPKQVNDNERIQFLETIFNSFRTGFSHSKPAIEYMQNRNLDPKKIEIGYNGGAFHYGKDESYIHQCLEYGLLLDKNLTGHKGEKIYSVFGKNCVAFPLRNEENRIVSLYFRSISNDKDQRHFYLKNRQGLYPGYPDKTTKVLVLTESIIDTASLIENNDYPVLGCYGTNGLMDEHMEAVKSLKELEEIIFAFDMDAAGKESTAKYAGQIHQHNKDLRISVLDLPCKDVNETLQGHSPEIFTHLIKERKPFLFSTESIENKKLEPAETVANKEVSKRPPSGDTGGSLNTSHPDCLLYQFNNLCFTLWGGIDVYNVNRLRATLHIRLKENEYRSFRDTVDLYSHTQSERLIKQASEKLESSPSILSNGITALTSELEQYRHQKRESKRLEEQHQDKGNKDIFTEEQMQASLALLKNKELNRLTHNIFNNLGLVGQQDNGMLLFFIFLTRLFKNPLHAIVMGSSGSGKTHLLQGVAQTIPKQHIHYTTSLSENTLYYTPKDFLKHKILLQEDLDGAYNALLPLRELMSNQSISRFSTKTNSRTGDSKQVYLQVEGPVCISGATTKERIYEDNANRSFLIQIEDHPAQERAVLEYQGKVASGEINCKSYEKNLILLKSAQLQLDPLEVLIPFASKLDLPPFVFKKLRTKSHYLTLIKSVTLWNQKNRQRRSDAEGNTFLLSTVEDVKWANYLCKESLLRKSDELPGKTRNFFESLKILQIKGKGQTSLFRSADIRQQFRLHPMQAKRYLDELESRGLIRCKTRSQRFGNEYEILVWDDYQILQSGLDILDETVKKLEASHSITPVSQPRM